MTFANIIREAGGSAKSFPKASNISVTLYDGDTSIIASESVYYDKPLFAHNRMEQSRFFKHLRELEQQPVDSMNVRIDAKCVVLYYKSPKAMFFARKSD